MKLFESPPLRTELPNREENILAEYKLLVAERRFVMTRYTQSLVVYPVIMGYAFKELLAIESLRASLIVAGAIFLLNSLYLYGADRFRSMAFHALNREAILAEALGMQQPHTMKWGYYIGISAFSVAYFLLVVVVIARSLHSFGKLVLP